MLLDNDKDKQILKMDINAKLSNDIGINRSNSNIIPDNHFFLNNKNLL